MRGDLTSAEGTHPKSRYQTESDDLAEEIYVLQEEKERLHPEDDGRMGLGQRMDSREELMKEQQTELTEYDEDKARPLIRRIRGLTTA